MIPTLPKCLEDAKEDLEYINTVLQRELNPIHENVKEKFLAIAKYRSDVDHWLALFDARVFARTLLDKLEDEMDPRNLISFEETRVKFVHSRMIGVQAYLSIKWALADCIAAFAGRVLCTPKAGQNEANPAQLVSHFIQNSGEQKTAAILYYSLRYSYGNTVCTSYVIRNHFIHDGAQSAGLSFFADSTADPAAAFKISYDSWKNIQNIAKEKCGSDVFQYYDENIWPANPCDDFRKIFDICEQEMDNMLGILIKLACETFLVHAECPRGGLNKGKNVNL